GLPPPPVPRIHAPTARHSMSSRVIFLIAGAASLIPRPGESRCKRLQLGASHPRAGRLHFSASRRKPEPILQPPRAPISGSRLSPGRGVKCETELPINPRSRPRAVIGDPSRRSDAHPGRAVLHRHLADMGADVVKV